MSSKFFHGSSVLLGDNTVPGVQLTPELKKYIPMVLKACKDWGLDFNPTVVQLLTYDEISEIAAYGGFPVRFPHWSFGMEYEELQRGYEFGAHKIYEMVINSNPCYIYNLSSNTLADHLTVVAHATGHNDFFKNNIHFSATDTNMLNKMANHGTRIRKYIARWGKERVTEFLDHVMRLETLIDGAEAWTERVVKEPNIRDERKYRKPHRLTVDKSRMYMEPFLNTSDFRRRENERVHERDLADELGIFRNPTKNILGFLRDNAPLKPWQADIVAMLYEEAMYFYPQRQTKVLNEGWASTVDSVIMAENGLIGLGQSSHDCGIVEYSAHKMGVLGGKYSTNPYKLGYYLLADIRERWDKGRFGQEWEECTDLHKKENWDLPTNLGKDKIFEVRKYYDDLTFIHEFFTEDFCRKQEYFYWKHYPNGEYRIESRDFLKIKRSLMRKHINGGLPDIKLAEPNYAGRGIMMLQHEHDGRELYLPYISDVLASIRAIWNNDVILSTVADSGEEVIFYASGSMPERVDSMTRKKFDAMMG
jgi:stage V sporulation protein R